MSSIAAGTTLTTALVSTGDTTGQLVLQTNGTTTAVTIGTDQSATFAGNVSVTGSITSTAGFSSPLAVKGNSTAGAELRLPEDTDNGSNYVALKAADSITSNVTFTLPAADGTSGQVLQTNGSGTLSFASPVSLATPLAVIGNATAGSEIRLPEDTDNGSNYVALKAADNIASNVTFTLPSADGTNGQVLQTNGSGTLSFATPAAGAMVYLASTTASDSATVSITTGITSTYDVYAIQLVNVIPATDGEGLRMRTSTNGGTSYDSGAGNYEWQIAEFGNGATSSSFSGADNKIQFYGQIGSAANELGVCGWVYLWKPSAAQYCMISNDIVLLNASGVYFIVKGFSRRLAAADVDAVQFYMSAGNISSGTFRLYGFANS